ncbi:hypothetical protein [Brevirhabdus sp.]|uniref:hypothetical protein n=1 Tax=Brevirhabdus sp. TaxID=2004514 RepID=UPI00405A1E30
MSRHIMDHNRITRRRAAEGVVRQHTLQSLAEVARRTGAAGPHRASLALQRRPRPGSVPGARMQSYLRIERGEQV